MPKPIHELEAGQRPLEERVLQFLVNNRDNGYTLNELIAGVESGGDRNQEGVMLLFLVVLGSTSDESRQMRSRYEEALATLADRKQVRIFQEGSVTYYAAAHAS
jgi:hypothetical protein